MPIARNQSLFTSSSKKQHRLGTKWADEEFNGEVYFYGRAGAADLAVGKLAVNPTIVANHNDQTVVSGAANSNEIVVTLGATAATANQYADGDIYILSSTGLGQKYRIRSHPAADASANLTITLFDEIVTALAATSKYSLVYNKWDNIVISASDQADVPVGVPRVTISATEYGWFQTWGSASVLADENLTPVGGELTIGSSTGGAVEERDATAEPHVGTLELAFDDGEYGPVLLQIHP